MQDQGLEDLFILIIIGVVIGIGLRWLGFLPL